MSSPSNLRSCFRNQKCSIRKPAKFHRLSYRNVGCTYTVSWPGSVSPMREKAAVSRPKASRLMKLPQRPMHCPMSRPGAQTSAIAPKGIFRFRHQTTPVRMPAITPP